MSPLSLLTIAVETIQVGEHSALLCWGGCGMGPLLTVVLGMIQ